MDTDTAEPTSSVVPQKPTCLDKPTVPDIIDQLWIGKKKNFHNQ